jgi:hypothetical protein
MQKETFFCKNRIEEERELTGADCWGGQHEPKNVAVGNISSGRNETLTTTTVAAEKEVRDQQANCSHYLHQFDRPVHFVLMLRKECNTISTNIQFNDFLCIS